jgi:dTDP-glucose 4,6-dehydratase
MDKSPKFVYLSTDMVLGNIAEDHKSIETDMVHPDNPYAASKACGEMYVISYAKSFGIQGIVVRCTNNYGPRQYPQKVCGRIIMSNLIGKPYTLGYGNVVKGWSYVEDTCSAIEYIANNGTIGEIYHIPASSYITIEELNSEIMKNFDKKIFIGFQEQRLKDDNQRSYLDGSKLLAMGWNHITPLDVGIKTTIEWFRRNEWFWK